MGAISAALLLGALVTTAYGMYRSCLLVLDHVHLSRSILRSSGRRALERVYGRMLASTPISRMLGGYRHRKRVEALEQGMPEVLRLLCTALESGSSPVSYTHLDVYKRQLGRPPEAPYGCFLPDLTRFGT